MDIITRLKVEGLLDNIQIGILPDMEDLTFVIICKWTCHLIILSVQKVKFMMRKRQTEKQRMRTSRTCEKNDPGIIVRSSYWNPVLHIILIFATAHTFTCYYSVNN